MGIGEGAHSKASTSKGAVVGHVCVCGGWVGGWGGGSELNKNSQEIGQTRVRSYRGGEIGQINGNVGRRYTHTSAIDVHALSHPPTHTHTHTHINIIESFI